MNTSSLSQRTYWGLTLYAIASLGSMATMSIGATLFIVLLVFGKDGPKTFLSEFRGLLTQSSSRFYFFCSLSLILCCLVSLVFASTSPLLFHGKGITVHFIKDLAKCWYFFLPLFLLVAWKRISLNQRNLVLRTWIITFGIVSAVGVVQFFTGWPRANPIPYLSGYYLTVLFFGHHLSVASIWIFPFFICLDLFFSPKARENMNLSRKSVGLFLVLGAFCLFFTWSRTLWVAMPISLLLWIGLRFSKKILLIATFVFIGIGLGLFQTTSVQTRLQSGLGVQDRVELWNANLDFLKSRLWTGVGFGKNQELSLYYFEEKYPGRPSYFIGHAHNLYLELIAGIGVLGITAWLIWIWSIFRNLIKSTKISELSWMRSGLVCAGLTFLMNGATQVNFWEAKVLHQWMWITSLILFISDTKPKGHQFHLEQ